MTPFDLAQQAVLLAGPYLTDGVAQGALREIGKNVWTWVAARLSGADAGAVAALQAQPSDPIAQADVQVRLAKLLSADPAALKQLQQLLAAAQAVVAKQEAKNEGDDNVVIQNAGSGNVTITR